jgi:hypothetical protein
MINSKNIKGKLIPHSRLITRIVTGVARRVSVVGQEQLIRSEYMKSPPIFMGVRVSFEKCIYFVSYLYIFKLVCTRCEIRIGITVLLFLNFKAYPIFENTQ